MFPKTLSGVFGLVALPLLLAGPAQAQKGHDTVNGYYAPRLQAKFVIQPITTTVGLRLAARIVSQPAPGTPLWQLGLKQGDVIVRLDGIPVTSYPELDNHYGQTAVRYIRQGSNQVQELMVDLGPLLSNEVVIPPQPGGIPP